MKKIFCFLLLTMPLVSVAQTTWSDHAATIVYEKCAKCHHIGGIAPFSLMNYQEVVSRAAMIQQAITSGEMPPSPPNENYQQFSHSKALTATQKSTLLDWLTNGTPEGNAANTPPPPIFNEGALLGSGDLRVRIPTYTSKAVSGQDDYACFSVPAGLNQDRVIKWVEIVPGNREIVHHALIFIDPNGVEVTDTIGGDCSSPANNSTKLIAAYTPGSGPLVLPSSDPLKLGFSMPAGSNIYFAMHYPDGSAGMIDSTEVIFHFYPQGETGIREVSTESLLQNWNFYLPPNQMTNVQASYANIPTDYSLLSVFPHMHLLGKSIRAFASKTGADTIRFIDIPHWDFHWQDFYIFKNLQKVSPGYTLRAQGTFDNTSGNPNNPSSPPVGVYPGLNTQDEMFLVYFHFLPYVAGDENYDLEALTTIAFQEALAQSETGIQVYPNPFSIETTLQIAGVTATDEVQVIVYDAQGRLINTLPKSETPGVFQWGGIDIQGQEAKPGLYWFSINVNGERYRKPILKHN